MKRAGLILTALSAMGLMWPALALAALSHTMDRSWYIWVTEEGAWFRWIVGGTVVLWVSYMFGKDKGRDFGREEGKAEAEKKRREESLELLRENQALRKEIEDLKKGGPSISAAPEE